MKQDKPESEDLPQICGHCRASQDPIVRLQEELKRVQTKLSEYERILQELGIHPDDLD